MANLHQKGKGYTRRALDAYDSPRAAVVPLLRVLSYGTEYTEPCAGKGNLLTVLDAYGHSCIDAYDLSPRGDFIRQADAMTEAPNGIVITNPPFDKLDTLLRHWLNTADAVWLLHPAPKLFNKNFAWAIPHLTTVVPIGRVIWIEGTKDGGYVDYVWACYTPWADYKDKANVNFYTR